MARMLEKPKVDKILAELEKVKETSLGSLLAFMHAYNLRFGPATTDDQATVYKNLYPIMADARDKTLKDEGVADGDAPVARGRPSPPGRLLPGGCTSSPSKAGRPATRTSRDRDGGVRLTPE